MNHQLLLFPTMSFPTESSLQELSVKEIVHKYKDLIDGYSIIGKHILEKTGKTVEQYRNMCLHEDCQTVDEDTKETNYCSDHLFLHECVKCGVIHDDTTQLEKVNVHHEGQSKGNYIYLCGEGCLYDICKYCNELKEHYAINESNELICEECYKNSPPTDNTTTLDLEFDYTKLKYYYRSMYNIYITKIFEVITLKSFYFDVVENGYSTLEEEDKKIMDFLQNTYIRRIPYSIPKDSMYHVHDFDCQSDEVQYYIQKK